MTDFRYIQHIDACGYGATGPRPMDEDDALEQAETEIRRLKRVIASLEESNRELAQTISTLRKSINK